MSQSIDTTPAVKPATCCSDHEIAICKACRTFARSEVDGQLEEVYERFDISELHADEDYQAWAQEYNARALQAQIEADEASGPSAEDERWYLREVAPRHAFVQKIFDAVNDLLETGDEDLRGLAEVIAQHGYEARSLEAKSWSEYIDRRQAMLDCQEWAGS